MREEALKLEKVKKSCKITAIVSQILEIILIVSAVVCIIGAIMCICLNKDINQSIIEVSTQEDMEEFNNIVASLDSVSTNGFLKVSFHMDRMLEEEQYGMVFGVICIFGAIICTMAAVLFDVIRRIFKMIRTSETPFTPEVLKGFKVMTIIICVELLLMSGAGAAILGGLIFWSIYNILDYGFTIQQQVDETL